MSEMTEVQDESCPLCLIDPRVIAAIELAKGTCSAVPDPDQKKKCMEWSEALDPKNIFDPEKVFVELLAKDDIDAGTAFNTFVSTQNSLIKRGYIRYIKENYIDKGLPIPENKRKYYQQWTLEEGL